MLYCEWWGVKDIGAIDVNNFKDILNDGGVKHNCAWNTIYHWTYCQWLGVKDIGANDVE